MHTPIDTPIITVDKTKKRNPFIGFLFSLFSPGLGQFYNGQIKKGILLAIILFLLPLFYRLLNLPFSFYGFLTILIINISYPVWVIRDAVKCARRKNNYQLQWFNKWYYYLLFFLLSSLAAIFYPAKTILGVRSFVIASPSMEPTLLNNDKCVSKIFTSKDKKIDYGDIVIHKIPDDQKFYTGRVVGLPGDSLEIKNDFLIINNKEPVTSLVKGNSEGFETKLEVTEMLPNGKIIHIYKMINAGSKVSNVPKFKIPFNSYYIMGDNRNDSYDSRFIGSIPEKDIYGKILYTVWGEKFYRINIDLTEKK